MRGYWWRPSQNRPPETEKETDVTTPIFIDHSQVGAYIDTLARFGAFGETGVRRLVYSPEWVAAMDQCRRWAALGLLQFGLGGRCQDAQFDGCNDVVDFRLNYSKTLADISNIGLLPRLVAG